MSEHRVRRETITGEDGSTLEVEIHSMPMLDTGIGKAAGFRDDAHLMEVAKAEREAMDPAARELADRIEAEVERRILFGDETSGVGWPE